MKNAIGFAILALTAGSEVISSSQSVSSAIVTFENVMVEPTFVLISVGTGDCATRTMKDILEIAPKEIRSVATDGGDVCYVFSFLAEPSKSPFGGGIAKPGDKVRLSERANMLELDGRREAPKQKSGFAALSARSDPAAVTGPTGSREGLAFGRTITLHDLSVTSSAQASGTYEHLLAETIDPTTPPQSKVDCVQEASGRIPFDGEWRTCIGWRTQWRCMRRQFVLVVKGPDVEAIKTGVVRCAGTAAVVGAVAAVASGGAAFVPAAEKTFYACLTGVTITSLAIDNRGGWTDWGGC